MDNLSENKVVLTDEKYKDVRGFLATWYIFLVIKLVLIALDIFLLIRLKWFFSVFGEVWGSVIWGILTTTTSSAICAVHEFQTTAQDCLDRDFLGFDKDGRHILEIFPGKSMRLAHREVRRYRRQKRLQQKERKERA